MSNEDPKLLNEIRSLKYGIIFSACIIAFALSISSNRGDPGILASLVIGVGALIGGATTKYLRK